jgi:hypothetical protein
MQMNIRVTEIAEKVGIKYKMAILGKTIVVTRNKSIDLFFQLISFGYI